jgi:hypothetical protein
MRARKAEIAVKLADFSWDWLSIGYRSQPPQSIIGTFKISTIHA